ncbi:hypothetical protein GW756_02915 [bacterium]|nr:hypothetical protein [bacterium]NCQ55531.1 hypothetical protein [Candidatus Parcubacteria bacterium]NCS67542.1 hypothetical protein [Candidatus Peregrinibacteria bacterium]NCS96293.1 hypothetical protein [bacterium]
MKKLKEKHVERLIKGKKSGVHLGSRQVPHHLYAYEQKQFDLAIKYGFLSLKEKHRVNLLNVWEKYCAAQERPMLVLKKYQNGKAEVWIDYEILNFDGATQARNKISEIT